MIWSNPIPQVGTSQMGKQLQLQKDSQRREKFKPNFKLSNPEVLHQEDKPPEHLVLHGSGAYVRESQKAGENREFTLKGHTQYAT